MPRLASNIRFVQVFSVLCVWAFAPAQAVCAQDLPTSQPKILTISREQVKVGRSADHTRNEAAWVKAIEQGKSAWYYLALTSLTGPNEAWYIGHFDSYTAQGEVMKHDDKDPALSAINDRFALADAEYVSSLRNLEAMARPDLSYGDFPDISKARFFEITTVSSRPGQRGQVENAAKAYVAAAKRAGSKTSFRTYQVTAGLPDSTYLIFSSVENYGQFDQSVADDAAIGKAATSEEMAALQKGIAEGIITMEKNRFRLDPAQSYVSKATRDKDPEFWMPK